jgi:hypothetical protein
MTQTLSGEEKARLKKQWTELAVKQFQEGQWEEAVNTNKNILNLFPTEKDAMNRLGKAYSELGMYTEARAAYAQTLKIDPENSIAKKNLDRLALLQETPAASAARAAISGERSDADLFIEETGKTGLTDLVSLAPAPVLAKVGVGDRVQLQVKGHTLYVLTTGGEVIGQVEPRLGNRLIRFMDGGNHYAAAVKAIEPNNVRIRIRETYQHPNMFGQVSFPSQGSASDTFRGYIKDTMLRDRDEEDELSADDDEYYDGGDETEDVSDLDLESTPEVEE